VHGHVATFRVGYDREGDLVKDVDVSFAVRAMTTGNDGRDDKMRNYCLDMVHHPNVGGAVLIGLGCERFYLTPAGLLSLEEVPTGWGWLELRQRKIKMVRAGAKNLRREVGFRYEMNLLLASLRRVEVRIEPQTITEFLKWKNRMVEYNGGSLPQGILSPAEELNPFLEERAGSL
jgi:hypothetical protein